ncbi:sigma-70 family RNA polymerase sigma factor [Streptomyces sp. WMMC500]|uniref:sigma-70 family RNA polymerase sigma factor n=1 Tax=Streptomyces sp. WMMC500 TaxID=3015154 RepID=UPI00248B411B|nr:sigma-70 family RNA polymerase sigma factor [Streptomyces sp. WMMC500]WBB64256.1 sigma-70 family RNA polymerase sigma factor [Streptomyces sp. WMMC500]
MTSSPDPEPARQPPPQHPPEQYEPYLDGLFTYCMSVLCDHDDAVAALGDVLAIAERQPRRRPATPAEWRPWLYSLARWACVRRLDQKPAHKQAQKPAQRPAHRSERSAHRLTHRPALRSAQRRPAAPAEEKRSSAVEPVPEAAAPESLEAAEAAARLHRRELTALAWPEAAGTTPEQREALELAVRHRLPADEVATVLGRHPDAARVLLSTAAAEVERTRAALAVVDQHGCPAIARLAGDSRLFLSAALSRELVRHVDDCAECRRAAERAGAGWAWPGTLRAARPEGPLPVLRAPRAAAYTAMLHAQRTRFAHPPSFDRRGYPRDPRHRAARRGRLRSRAVTSTVVATVLAAPVLALWAANRGAQAPGEAQSGWPPPSAGADDPEKLDGRPVEKAGSAHDDAPRSSDRRGNRPDVSVEVVDHGGPTPGRPGIGPGRLTVEAWPAGETTYLRLRASGGAPVDWRIGTDGGWLRFSATYGTLRPGEATTVAVTVAKASEPRGAWQARVYVSPGGAAILITGSGAGRTGPQSPARPPAPDRPHSPSPPGSPDPSDPAPSPSDPDPSPSDPDPSTSDPGPSPSDPGPTPTPSAPDPSAPGSSSPARVPSRAG